MHYSEFPPTSCLRSRQTLWDVGTVGARVVKLQEKRRALETVVMRLTRLDAPGPAEGQGVDAVASVPVLSHGRRDHHGQPANTQLRVGGNHNGRHAQHRPWACGCLPLIRYVAGVASGSVAISKVTAIWA